MSKSSNLSQTLNDKGYSSSASNGVITLTYVIDGIQVEDTKFEESVGNYSYNVSHTFDEAKLVLNDKLLEVMSILKTFKKRFESDYYIRVHFKNNIVKVIITLEPEKQIDGYHGGYGI